MPRSSALWITAREPSRSTGRPKLLQPSPTAETRRPDLPTFRSCMGLLLPAAGKQRVQPRDDFGRGCHHAFGQLSDRVSADPGYIELLLVGFGDECRILEYRRERVT